MGNWPDEVESAYQSWVNDLENSPEVKERELRERKCIHHQKGASGQSYSGADYLRALQRLRGDAALRMARKVPPFFWTDAPHIRVWLCHDCAAEIRL